jgi:hypothetical protein
MAISNNELIQIYGIMGVGRMPLTGGPAGNLTSVISQTFPYEFTTTTYNITSTTLVLNAIYITAGQTIRNINFVSISAESSGSHLFFALYDDGRGTTGSGSALLGQTLDQTGAAAFGSNTNLGLSLITPYTTTYTGIHYIAIAYTGSTLSVAASTTPNTTSSSPPFVPKGNGVLSGNTGVAVSSQAPNPSGTFSEISPAIYIYGYVS